MRCERMPAGEVRFEDKARRGEVRGIRNKKRTCTRPCMCYVLSSLKYGKEGDSFRKRVAWQHVRVTY